MGEVLKLATQAVSERGDAYGHPAVNFARQARLMNAFFGDRLLPGERFDAQDIAIIGILIKLARMQEPGGYGILDHPVDVAGYANAFWEAGRGMD